jgi:hypothetical protein
MFRISSERDVRVFFHHFEMLKKTKGHSPDQTIWRSPYIVGMGV